MAFALVGCGAGSGGTPTLQDFADQAARKGYAWQARVLSDGDITLDEYDEGHRRALDCLTAAGLTYSDPERNIPDGFRWNFDVFWHEVGEAEGIRAAAECADENSGLELAMTAWGRWETPPDVLAATSECIGRAGFEIDSDVTNYRGLWLAGAEQGLTKEKVASCVVEATHRLYPATSGVSVGF